VLLILTITLFIFIMLKEDKKPITIEPIKIETSTATQKLSSEKLSSQKVEKEKPVDILSKLKVATKVSTEGIVPSKEEVSNKVLESLKKSIAKQEIDEPIEVQAIVKEVVKEKVVPKRVVQKRIVHKKVVHKKIATKRVVKKRVVAKKVKVAKKIKIAKKKKIIQKQPTKEQIQSTQIVQNAAPAPKRHSNLTREEEVALYHKKYASNLEVVNVSKPFVIKEKKSVPDSYYFEAPKAVKTTYTNPTKFVKTLGVVAVSNAYETPLVIPKKVEVAKEGVVALPHAKVETEEMKKLRFVKPLAVVEVSKPFETIEADKYLK